MKFGLFFEHQVPRPWADGDEARVFAEALEQIELADRLGFDCVWLVEHHFLEEYSHSSAPGAVPRRGVAAHDADPPRPRHRALRAGDQPSGAGRRARSRPSTCSRAAASSSAPARVRPRRSSTRSASTRPTSARCGRRACASRCAASPRRRSPVTSASTCACRRATSCRSRSNDRIRRCGSRAAAARRSTSRRSTASARSAFAFFDPEEARHWVDDYYDDARGRRCSDRRRGEREPRVRHVVLLPSRRGRGRSGAAPRASNFIGYSLGHYYVFGRHLPGGGDLWDDYRPAPRGAGLRPRGGRARGRRRASGSAPRSSRRARAGSAARWARPTRCATTSAATRTAASTR